VLAAEAVEEGFRKQDLSPDQFADYGLKMREGVENMRKLVYAFYDQSFSFKDVIMRHPEPRIYLPIVFKGIEQGLFSTLGLDWRIHAASESLPYGIPLK